MGNYGNELADRLAKESTKNKETIYKKKNTENSNSTTGETTKHRKVANPMGTNINLQTTKQIFPNIKESLGKRIQHPN